MLRGHYLAEMTTFRPDQLVWIDETGCRNKDSIRVAGYALRGIPVRRHLLVKGKRVSCIADIACDELVAIEATITTANAQIFFDFVRGSLILNIPPFDGSSPCSVAVMDNCSIHHADSVKLFQQAGILLIFLPPYSPDLNP